jgi:hypothetical protein
MLLTVRRAYGPKATPGTLYINGNFHCHTLELPREKCIPEGEYALHLTYSPRFNRIMPQIMNVSGFEGIRIHWGNFVKDTQGCLLVGYEKSVDGAGVPCVLRSKVCFNELFAWLQEANKGQVLSIEFKEDPAP